MSSFYYLICSDKIDTKNKNNSSAFDIYKRRITESKWPLYTTTRHSDEIKHNDKLLIYLAGNQKYCRHFIAYVEVAKVEPVENLKFVDIDSNIGLIKSYLILKNNKEFLHPFNVKENLDTLSFIIHKKSYGLFFQGGVRKIDEKSFNQIISSSK